MAKLTSLFSILRWSLILTLILVIVFALAPVAFPKYFSRVDTTRNLFFINCVVIVGLSVFGLFSICCYYFYLTLLFAIILTVYIIAELILLNLNNAGIWLPMIGIDICSFTYCAAMRRLRREALYGP